MRIAYAHACWAQPQQFLSISHPLREMVFGVWNWV